MAYVLDVSQQNEAAVRYADADTARAATLFQAVGRFMFGDQLYSNTDANPYASATYIVASPDGSASVVGQPVSNRQTLATGSTGIVLSPVLLLGGLLLFLVLKKG